MIKVSATKLRNSLFDYLDKVTEGEIIIIQRNNKDIARLVSIHQSNWRDRMTIRPKLLVSPEEVIEPIEDIWENYV
jgi:prevent-host-death family protein